MPQEHRKRGKRRKAEKSVDNEESFAQEEPVEEAAGPSWIVPAKGEDVDPNAPFGFVDPDVKAYFRTVDEKLKEWQEERYPADEDIDNVNPTEARRIFLVAALDEMTGKEKQLATDPDCSAIIERMAYSMDDFVKRVFLGRLAGSFLQLSKHRFASHVVQSLLAVSKGTVSREAKGTFATIPESDGEEGKLPTMSELVKSICDELLPSISSLMMDPFASHVVRGLLMLLSPTLAARYPDSGPQSLRSKKSAKFRRKQGPMSSIFNSSAEEPNGGDGMAAVPPMFADIISQYVQKLRDDLSDNELRALAADQVACPVLVLVLELEDLLGKTNERSSLMDSVSVGLISSTLHESKTIPPPSDYIAALVREPVSSHLLETLVSLSPPSVFDIIWDQHFVGKLQRVAVHPIANFVVAKAIERLSAGQLSATANELTQIMPKLIKTSRTRVIQALIERSTALKSSEQEIVDYILEAFGLFEGETRGDLVQCVLRLQTFKEYQKSKAEGPRDDAKEQLSSKKGKVADGEPSVQGALLLQTILDMNEPFNFVVLDCITSMPIQQLLAVAHHVSGSRVLDKALDSPAVPARAKRKLAMAFIGHYHELVDDRMGSHVGERCWAFADPYLKEKIARSLFEHEHRLKESMFGRFFASRLFLHELRNKPEQWKERQRKPAASEVTAATPGSNSKNANVEQTSRSKQVHEDSIPAKTKEKKRKRDVPKDEIDAVFSVAHVSKYKKGSLATDFASQISENQKSTIPSTGDLDAVLGAIKVAPKDQPLPKKKRQK